MRETTITLNNKEYTLRANFKTSKEISEKVGDPLMISREGALEAMMLERGLTYEPKWKFTIDNMVSIIYIGAKAYDSKVTRDVIEDAVFETGFFESRDQAIEYLAIIVGPKPDLPDNTEKSSSSEK